MGRTPRKTVRMAAAILPAAAVVCLLLAPRAARADIFKYTDENGVVHFSNNPVDNRYQVYIKDEQVPAPPPQVDTDTPKESRYDNLILGCAAKHAVDPALIKAVMKVESDFNPAIVSVDGAIGLMQLMPDTAEHLGVRNPYDPGDNVSGGAKHLSDLLKQFSSRHLALAAYNAGEKAVERHGGIPPYSETQQYVRNVLRCYEAYRKAGYGLETASASPAPPQEQIYSITREDGVMVYTNTPWLYREPSKR